MAQATGDRDRSGRRLSALARTDRARGVVCVLGGALCWGLSGTCIEYLTQDLGMAVAWATSLRMSFSAIVLVGLCLALRRDELTRLVRDRRSWRDLVMYGVFGCFGCQVTYMMTIANSNAGIATLIEQLGLVIVVAHACIVARRGPRTREVLAVILAIGGLFFICTHGDPTKLAISGAGLGWGLASTVTMALYVLLPARLMKRWSGLSVTAVCITIGAVASVATLRPWEHPLELSPMAVVAVLVTVVFGVVLAYLLFLQGVRSAGPMVASLLDCMEPVSAMVFSAVLLGTLVTGYDLVGAALIVMMMVTVALPDKRIREAER